MRSITAILVHVFLLESTIAGRQDKALRHDVVTKILDPRIYDSKVLPNYDQDFALDVSVQLSVLNIYAISETSMDYSVDLMFRQQWVDERLDFQNVSSDEKLELGVSHMDKLWVPDTFFINEKKASIHTVTTPNKLIHVFRNGTILYGMRIAMTLGCNMNLRLYPFDHQTCSIKLQSFAYSMDNIQMSWWEDALSIGHPEMPQFELQPYYNVEHYIEEYPSGNFSTLSANVRIARKMGHYVLSVFLPSVLLVMLSWVSFWVDPKAVPARVSLGVTCILTMTTQTAGISHSLPPVSYVKMIDIWMFVCLLFLFGALLEFAYVNVLLQTGDTTSTGDKDAKDSEAGEERSCSRKIVCLPAGVEGITHARRVDTISKFLFPGSFIIFLTVFVLVGLLAPQ